jgi:hypothetical protein
MKIGRGTERTMGKQSGRREDADEICMSVTARYEQEILRRFRTWYRTTVPRPTISEADAQAYVFTHSGRKGLEVDEVVQLLREHPEWIHTWAPKCESDGTGVSIGELTRRHLSRWLEQCIQRRGLESM